MPKDVRQLKEHDGESEQSSQNRTEGLRKGSLEQQHTQIKNEYPERPKVPHERVGTREQMCTEIVDRFVVRHKRIGEYAQMHHLPFGEAAKRLDQENLDRKLAEQLAVQEAATYKHSRNLYEEQDDLLVKSSSENSSL